MNLLSKEYFSLQEICNIWSVSKEDLLYYGENGILEISVRPAAIAAGLETDGCGREIEDIRTGGEKTALFPSTFIADRHLQNYESRA